MYRVPREGPPDLDAIWIDPVTRVPSPTPPASRLERGRLVARLLARAWRPASPATELSEDTISSITPMLTRAGSGGLAWWRLRGSTLRETTSVLPLRDLYRLYTLNMALLERRLAETFEHLRSAGVEPLLAKGWSVGRLYPERGLRPYGDIDIIVIPSQFDAASAALLDPARPECPVELHRSFLELADRSSEDLFERSRLVELHGTEIRVLAPEDHLRLLALHALNHGIWRPLWLCDLAVMLESFPDAFDWELCMAGHEWRSEGVRCALGLAGRLLDARLDAVPSRWSDPPLPSWMVTAAFQAWGAEAHYMAGRHMGEYLRHPKGIVDALRIRWPNAIEATYRLRAPFDNLPRLPFQLAETVHRAFAFAVRAISRR